MKQETTIFRFLEDSCIMFLHDVYVAGRYVTAFCFNCATAFHSVTPSKKKPSERRLKNQKQRKHRRLASTYYTQYFTNNKKNWKETNKQNTSFSRFPRYSLRRNNNGCSRISGGTGFRRKCSQERKQGKKRRGFASGKKRGLTTICNYQLKLSTFHNH